VTMSETETFGHLPLAIRRETHPVCGDCGSVDIKTSAPALDKAGAGLHIAKILSMSGRNISDYDISVDPDSGLISGVRKPVATDSIIFG
jgi:hypothetical protein